MPTPDEKETNDPSSRKLPPTNREPEPSNTPGGWIPTAGVSPKLKIFVIGLTFITIMAFGIFIAMFVKKVFVKGPDKTRWGPQLVTIAEKLKKKGLKPQAIEHYQRYLDTQEVDMETRSKISFDIAQLYVELGKCDDAVVWFLHSKVAEPEEHRVQKSNTQIQQCLNQAKTSQQ